MADSESVQAAPVDDGQASPRLLDLSWPLSSPLAATVWAATALHYYEEMSEADIAWRTSRSGRLSVYVDQLYGRRWPAAGRC